MAGVRVGQTTVRDGAGIRTGVTAIVPDQVDRAGGQLPAGLFVRNGYGKLIGATQLAELGVIGGRRPDRRAGPDRTRAGRELVHDRGRD